MAQVPNVPLPSVSPSAQPTPTQTLDAPAEAFGANVGAKATGDLAQATGKVSDQLNQYAAQMAAIDNKQAADNASIKAATAMDAAWTNFKANNTQAAAYNNLPEFAKSLEETRKGFGAGLSPLAQVEFESASRRSAFGVLSEASGYAAAQRRAAITDTAAASVKLAGDQLASNPDDPDAQKNFHQVLGTQAAQVFATTGLPPDDPQIREWMKQQASPVYGSMVKQAYDSGDLAKAQSLLAAHRDDMTTAEYTTLAGGLRVADHANMVANAADAMVSGGVAAPQSVTGLNAPGNNPTNLTTLPAGQQWPGQSGTNGRFATFTTPEAGIEAAVQNLHAYGAKDGINTLQGIANRWAPKGDGQNDPAAYAAALGKTLGVSPTAPLNMNDSALLHRIVQAQIPLEQGRSGSAVRTTYNPIPFSPSMTADEYVANGDTVLQQRSKELFPNSASDAQAAFNAAHQRLMINAQVINKTQGAIQDKLQGFVVDHGVTDITAVQKAFPTEWSQLPSRYQLALERDVLFQGSQETPERQTNYAKYQGMAMTQPSTFADPVKTDLKADQNLSISDRKSLENLQRQMATSEANKTARTAQLKTYLSNPLVANMVSRTWPTADDKRSDDYSSFLGALDGALQRAQTAEGKPPTQDEITKAAQTLITTHSTGGFFGIGATKSGGHVVPQVEADKINGAYKQSFGRDLSAAEVAQIYFYNKGVQ